jgi:3'(2'), 5'-bisphosphate nucleotidase
MSVSPAALLDAVAALAARASAAILEVYATAFEVEAKDDRSPLTEADRRAHAILAEGLPGVLDVPVLSEESAAVPYAQRRAWTRYWLVDPLDGTREFVKRNGEFTVNVALIEDGTPVLGIVHVPVSGLSYRGVPCAGAWRVGADGEREPIRVRDYRGGPLKIVASRSHADERTAAFLARLPAHEVLSIGSALKICLVAQGSADLYPRFGPTSEWDTAAAHAVLVAAGGALTDLALAPLRYNAKDSLLNPAFFAFGAGAQPWRDALAAVR